MKNILVVGGSKGIGREIVNSQLEKGNYCYNFSRTESGINNQNLIEEKIDILSNDLPNIENIDLLRSYILKLTDNDIYELEEISLTSAQKSRIASWCEANGIEIPNLNNKNFVST